MKARYVIIVSGLAGAALGVGITWADFGNAPPLETASAAEAPITADDQRHQPELVLNQTFHDFGPIQRDTTVSHAFRFTNVGTGALTLKAGSTTCTACTIAELSKTRVAPGQTAEVVVQYTASAHKPNFKQIATVLTNDPRRPRVELNISGTVTSEFRLLPPQIVMSNVSASQPTTESLRILCFLSDQVRVVEHAFTGSESPSLFEATFEPLGPDELAEEEAKSGVRMLVTVKPGLPLGPFRQTIRLTVATGSDDKRTEMVVAIKGAVVSDLSLVGPGWHKASGILTIGNVASDQGAKRSLRLLVHGETRRDVEIEPVKLDPPWLRVTLGKPAELNESVMQIPLTIEIPPGRPPAIFLGTDQGKLGEIVLGVKNHPDAKQIRMRVKFVIENKK